MLTDEERKLLQSFQRTRPHHEVTYTVEIFGEPFTIKSSRHDVRELAAVVDAEIRAVAVEFHDETPLRQTIIAMLRLMDMV